MNSKAVLIAIATALIIVGLYQLTFFARHEYPEYSYTEGQISDINLVSPFDFPIYKSEETVKQEAEALIRQISPPYRRDPGAEFAANSKLDQLFDCLVEGSESRDWEAARMAAQNSGFKLTDNLETLNGRTSYLISAYGQLRLILEDIYARGIIADTQSDSILLVSGNGVDKRRIEDFYQLSDAKLQLVRRLGTGSNLARVIEANLDQLLLPNLEFDQAKYAELSEQAKSRVNLVAGQVKQNEEIIHLNQRLSANDINKLESLTREYQKRENRNPPLIQLINFVGLLCFVLAILIGFHLLSARLLKPEQQSLQTTLVLSLFLISLVGLAILNSHVLRLDALHIPLALLVISSAVLLGYDFAVLTTITGILLIGPFIDWQASNMALLTISSLLTLALMYRFRSKHDFLRIWLFLFGVLNAINLILAMHFFTGVNYQESIKLWLKTAGYSLVSTSVSIIGSMAVIAFFERKWNLATKQVLLNLLEFEHPLLKKLATAAPGTYHHSLIVGNLAERTAEAIGANALLARVGSYYHDIGKISLPEIYTENNEDSADYHSQLTPEQSAEAIRNHVREGVALAAKHRLPQAVADIILQHHGTSYIRYFLDAAQRSGEVLDLDLFRYPGPLPRTKEAALVMLADVIESTTKAKAPANENEIDKIIGDAANRLIRDGQFDAAPISLADLSVAKKVMEPILESIYRKRLDYPEEKGV